MANMTWYHGAAELDYTPTVKMVLPRSQEPMMRLACKRAGLAYDPRAFIYTDEAEAPVKMSLWARFKAWFSA